MAHKRRAQATSKRRRPQSRGATAMTLRDRQALAKREGSGGRASPKPVPVRPEATPADIERDKAFIKESKGFKPAPFMPSMGEGKIGIQPVPRPGGGPRPRRDIRDESRNLQGPRTGTIKSSQWDERGPRGKPENIQTKAPKPKKRATVQVRTTKLAGASTATPTAAQPVARNVARATAARTAAARRTPAKPQTKNAARAALLAKRAKRRSAR